MIVVTGRPASGKSTLAEILAKEMQDVADMRIIICDITPDLAKARFADRRLYDPNRDRFHGDNLLVERGGVYTATFEHLNMDVPVLKVDTAGHYNPGIQQILDFINKRD